MNRSPLVWIGLAGIEPDDNPRALLWQRRLHWVMAAIALLALPAYVLDSAHDHGAAHRIATILDGVILVAFVAETAWMTFLSSHRARYLAENWLNHLIILATLASLLGAATEWIALVRVVRVAVAGMVMTYGVVSFRMLFSRRGAPLLIGAAFLLLLVSGAMFYWLEPTIHDYWDGLWLAFVTGMTIGYGDVVPTTGPARMVAVFTGLIGVAVVTVFTANIVSFFVGRDETEQRRRMQQQMSDLERAIERLFASEEVRFREDLHRDINQLRRQMAELVHAEELQFRRQFQHEIAALRADVASRSSSVVRGAKNAPGCAACGVTVSVADHSSPGARSAWKVNPPRPTVASRSAAIVTERSTASRR
jgi:voltage-gated potassium channel